MGWSSWFAEDFHISDRIVREQAGLLVSSGLADHGYGWVNIDDGWAVKQGTDDPDYRGPERDADGNLRPNGKFPDMKAMCDYVHGKGVKLGIYSSPGKLTCGGYPGSYGHEEQDARQFAAWGFDLLKYDWCSYDKIATDKSLEELQKPYRIMSEALGKTGRDFTYSLCQYGMGDVWNWGREVGGHYWRTSMDIAPSPRPVWETMTENGFSNAGREKHIGPGGWNDPDFLLVGYVRIGEESLPTPLTPNEQYLQVSLWSMLSAPLLVSADLKKLDAFTLNLLTNDEVIAIDQDPLGRQGVRVSSSGSQEVWVKDLADSGKAVALFNRGETETAMTVKWSELRINGPHRVRDVWRQKDLGRFAREFRASVPRHGVVLVRLTAWQNQN
jgi:alpha-galactosidase